MLAGAKGEQKPVAIESSENNVVRIAPQSHSARLHRFSASDYGRGRRLGAAGSVWNRQSFIRSKQNYDRTGLLARPGCDLPQVTSPPEGGSSLKNLTIY